MNKQQTAVEWLVEQLVKLDKQLDGRRKSNDSTVIKLNPTKIYEQAKEMEKQQTIDFTDSYILKCLSCNYNGDPISLKETEQYYKENFDK